MSEENLNEQELIYKFGIFERQIRELQQQIESVERGIIELNSLNLGLNELVDSVGKEIFAPMGRGIFVKAKLISEELNVDIGNGNIVKKSIPDTKKLIEEQMKKLEEVKKDLENNLEEIGGEMTQMMNSIQRHSHEHCHCENGEECNCNHDDGECSCGDDCKCEKED